MTLRYPIDGTGDWVTFQAHEYRSNASGGNGQPAGAAIVLYMPNSTPTVTNGQTWESKKFEGPMGVAAREIGVAVAGGATDGLGKGLTEGGYGVVDGLKAAAGQIKNLPDIARQGAITAAGQFAGTSANQIMALSRGKVFNPNIELLYEGPNVRSFNFNFNFIPKSASEAARVAAIILQFKKLSAPLQVSQMYEIPKVWQVSYSGVGGSWMNKFKKAAMTSISVQYNAGLDQHATFSNGFPIRTDIQMSFQEVDVITRNDHTGPMGY
jgi:hypothetical protein